ncbi:MAG: MaoC family dehydratase N-terminal domain-containing protein [Selenomonadaceae bacterium]|nr:MaoC family dehydratase N-terminal domain-containing protein [Selenomonadaceae bacterium]
MMQNFCELSGDINPMHIDVDFARDNGCKDKLVYGMLSASFYSKLVGVYLPGKYCLLQNIHVKFHKPVYVGDRLTISGKVSDIIESVKRLEIKATIRNQDGVKVSSAIIKVGCLK